MTVKTDTSTMTAAELRYHQAMVDADIEGHPRDAEIEDLSREMAAQNVPMEERVRRYRASLAQRRGRILAAE